MGTMVLPSLHNDESVLGRGDSWEALAQQQSFLMAGEYVYQLAGSGVTNNTTNNDMGNDGGLENDPSDFLTVANAKSKSCSESSSLCAVYNTLYHATLRKTAVQSANPANADINGPNANAQHFGKNQLFAAEPTSVVDKYQLKAIGSGDQYTTHLYDFIGTDWNADRKADRFIADAVNSGSLQLLTTYKTINNPSQTVGMHDQEGESTLQGIGPAEWLLSMFFPGRDDDHKNTN